jgi:hypothetical protein
LFLLIFSAKSLKNPIEAKALKDVELILGLRYNSISSQLNFVIALFKSFSACLIASITTSPVLPVSDFISLTPKYIFPLLMLNFIS